MQFLMMQEELELWCLCVCSKLLYVNN